MLSEVSTELYYQEGSSFRKRIVEFRTRTFELGIESGKNISSWVIVGFMESDKIYEQSHVNSVFDWLPVSSAVC